jgi:hypothetical protein
MVSHVQAHGKFPNLANWAILASPPVLVVKTVDPFLHQPLKLQKLILQLYMLLTSLETLHVVLHIHYSNVYTKPHP